MQLDYNSAFMVLELKYLFFAYSIAGLPGQAGGHRTIPFRHPEYSEDESKLLEEITTNMAASRIKARDPFTGGRFSFLAPMVLW